MRGINKITVLTEHTIRNLFINNLRKLPFIITSNRIFDQQRQKIIPPPEPLDVTEELLLESVDELDFAEDELFVDEDETLPLLSLLLSLEDSFSGSTKLLLSSSPQAVNDMVMANSARARNLLNLIRLSSMQKSVIAYTQQSRP